MHPKRLGLVASSIPFKPWPVLPVIFETETFGKEAAKKKRPWFCFPCWTEDDKAQLETSLVRKCHGNSCQFMSLHCDVVGMCILMCGCLGQDLTTWSLSDAERGKARECLEQARQAGQAGEGHRPCMCFIRQDWVSMRDPHDSTCVPCFH